ARAAARPRVELRLWRRRARARDVRELSAQEARCARPVADPHRARRRLRPAGAAQLMASLRTRVLVSVLVLSAAGLVALGAVTYAEQRSFLEGRIDQPVKAATPAMSQALDSRGYLPAGSEAFGGRAGGGTRRRRRIGRGTGRGRGGGGKRGRGGFGRGPGGGPGPNLPPGTYGERREASGKVIGQPLEFTY